MPPLSQSDEPLQSLPMLGRSTRTLWPTLLILLESTAVVVVQYALTRSSLGNTQPWLCVESKNSKCLTDRRHRLSSLRVNDGCSQQGLWSQELHEPQPQRVFVAPRCGFGAPLAAPRPHGDVVPGPHGPYLCGTELWPRSHMSHLTAGANTWLRGVAPEPHEPHLCGAEMRPRKYLTTSL